MKSEFGRGFLGLLLGMAIAATGTGDRGGTARAETYVDDDPGRVGRVSHLEGRASLRQAGSSEWEDVDSNFPVFAGDEFYTDHQSFLEIQMGGGRYVRLAERTDIVLVRFEPTLVRIELPYGSVILSLKSLGSGEYYEVSAPAAAVAIRDPGLYRVEVDETGNTTVSVANGYAEANGSERSVSLEDGDLARFRLDDPFDLEESSAYWSDSFSSWSAGRDVLYEQWSRDALSEVVTFYDRTDLYGLQDLSPYGRWVTVSEFGLVWAPWVPAGWSPYSNGYFYWNTRFGYTWVPYEPWGWATYHYGRWIYDPFYGWAWVPWSQYAGGYYYWRPACVYWYTYPSYNGYAWVPLAPNEPYIEYRQARNHHPNRDFRPVHLRHGRGINLAEFGSAARVKPVRTGDDIKGREPVTGAPGAPPRIVRLKPRFDTRPVETIKRRQMVVTDPATVKPRSGGIVTSTGKPEAHPAEATPRVRTKPVDGTFRPRGESVEAIKPVAPRRSATVDVAKPVTPRREAAPATPADAPVVTPKPRRDVAPEEKAPPPPRKTAAPVEAKPKVTSKPSDPPPAVERSVQVENKGKKGKP
jgi:hypothetical protein